MAQQRRENETKTKTNTETEASQKVAIKTNNNNSSSRKTEQTTCHIEQKEIEFMCLGPAQWQLGASNHSDRDRGTRVVGMGATE